MVKITKQFLKKVGTCPKCIAWWEENGQELGTYDLLIKLKKHNRYWAEWVLAHALSKKQIIQIGIFAAEHTLEVWDDLYSKHEKFHKFMPDTLPKFQLEACKYALIRKSKKNIDNLIPLARYSQYLFKDRMVLNESSNYFLDHSLSSVVQCVLRLGDFIKSSRYNATHVYDIFNDACSAIAWRVDYFNSLKYEKAGKPGVKMKHGEACLPLELYTKLARKVLNKGIKIVREQKN